MEQSTGVLERPGIAQVLLELYQAERVRVGVVDRTSKVWTGGSELPMVVREVKISEQRIQNYLLYAV